MNDTVFIAGVYGTGKSTICSKLALMLNTPSFSAGDLISKVNGEKYGSNKAVVDKYKNQLLLAERVKELNTKFARIILAGHFCIFSASNKVEILPDSVFSKLNISRIILLEAKTEQVIEHLQRRDGKTYNKASVNELVLQEKAQAEKITDKLNCPLYVYQMTFSDTDAKCIGNFIIGGRL